MVKPPLRTKSIGFKVSEEEYAQLETAAQASAPDALLPRQFPTSYLFLWFSFAPPLTAFSASAEPSCSATVGTREIYDLPTRLALRRDWSQ